MKTRTHVLIAVLISIFIALYFGFEKVYLFGIVLGVLLPDILEPPVSMHHRRFFHSRKFLKFLVLAAIVTFIISLAKENFLWPFFIEIGYIVHLLCDSFSYRLPK